VRVSSWDAFAYGCGRAQTANYGMLPNPAMPRSFLADSFDLGDPWHTPQCGTNGTYGGGPSTGQMCCVDEEAPLGALCKGDHRGLWALNDTRDWADLGTLHPRMKKPIGRRLAAGLHATAYNGSGPVSGPVLAGCSVEEQGRILSLRFNTALLKGQGVLFNDSSTVAKEDTALYVLCSQLALRAEFVSVAVESPDMGMVMQVRAGE
jgi:hypothetical protein